MTAKAKILQSLSPLYRTCIKTVDHHYKTPRTWLYLRKF